jgi:hypothetical protein
VTTAHAPVHTAHKRSEKLNDFGEEGSHSGQFNPVWRLRFADARLGGEETTAPRFPEDILGDILGDNMGDTPISRLDKPLT